MSTARSMLVRPSLRDIRVYTTGPRRRALLQAVEQYEEARRTARRRMQRAHLMSMLVNPYVFAAPGGSSVIPAYAAGASLIIWHRADLGLYSDAGITPATTNGASVYQWNDLSGNNNHATKHASSSTSPTLATSAINGENAIVFNNQFYGLANVLSGLTAGEVFCVVKVDADPPASGTPGEGGLWHLGDQGGFNTHFPYTDGTWYESFGALSRFTVGNPTPSLSSTYRVINIYSASNDWEPFIDGVSLGHQGVNGVRFPQGTSGFVPSLGASLDYSNYVLKGRIAEFLLHSTKLGGTDRATVNAALGARYGLF